jgi:glucose/arabinose dehydrogenase
MMRKLPHSIAIASFLSLYAAAGFGAPAPAREASFETRPPSTDYKPAFANQTRAPAAHSPIALDVTTVVTGLELPWAFQFLPDGRMIVTETKGRIRIVDHGRLSPPVAGTPAVTYNTIGGFLDLVLDPDFAKNQTIFFTYVEPRTGGNGTVLARARLVDGPAPRLEDLKVIFRQMPTVETNSHHGARILFAPDGTLFLTLGERFIPEAMMSAQDLSTSLGKIVRLIKDGSAARGNPFAGRAKALPEIWSLGHRNPEGVAFDPVTHHLWSIEHGPKGGDELNLIEPGKNYGWPVITYGVEQTGKKIGNGITAKQGMEQPVYYWDPVLAPSNLLFYTGKLFPAWRNSLFVSGLAGEKLSRLVLKNDRVVSEEWLLQDQHQRLRDVKQGPDDAIYVATDNGAILRVAPK